MGAICAACDGKGNPFDPCETCDNTGTVEGNEPEVCPKCKGSGLLKGTMGVKVSCFACHGTGDGDGSDAFGTRKPKRSSREEILYIAKTNAVVAAELARWHRGEISWEGAVNRALVSLAESCAVQEEQLAKTRWPSQCSECDGPKSIQERLCPECSRGYPEKNLAPNEP